jgi:hypothetical protein
MTSLNQPARPLRPVLPGGPQLPHPLRVDVPVTRPVVPVDWFRRVPNGGTTYRRRLT